jgi:small subunit ribosomal protein S5
MGLVDASSPAKKAGLTAFTEEDKASWAQKYTPEQLRVIEAGEEAINPDDLAVQGRMRTDHWRLPYLDDMSVIKPVLDKKPRAPKDGYTPEWRWMDEQERTQAMASWLQSFKPTGNAGSSGESGSAGPNGGVAANGEDAGAGPTRLDFWKWMDSTRLTVGYDAEPVSSEAAPIPKLTDPRIRYKKDVEGNDEDGSAERLRKQTGMTQQEIRALKVKVLVDHRVVNQTRLGKIQSMYCLAVAGNGAGRLGIGEGKASEPDEAQKLARLAAIRNMQPIPRYENRTIYGEVEGKVSAVEVKLSARPPGKQFSASR